MPDPREKLEGLGETWDSADVERALKFQHYTGRLGSRLCELQIGNSHILVVGDVAVSGKCEPVNPPRAASVNIAEPLDWEVWRPVSPWDRLLSKDQRERLSCPNNFVYKIPRTSHVPKERRASNADIIDAARRLSVDPGIIWAIGEVETGSCGFYAGSDSLIPVRRNRYGRDIEFTDVVTDFVPVRPNRQGQSFRFTDAFGVKDFSQRILELRDWGFGRWMVLGINFAHKTVYISERDKMTIERQCPREVRIRLEIDKVKLARLPRQFYHPKYLMVAQFEIEKPDGTKPSGLYRSNSRLSEMIEHDGAYILRSETGGDGKTYQVECAYDGKGQFVNNSNNSTPNLYKYDWNVRDPGDRYFQFHRLAQQSALYQFYVDMHTNERVQLQYFEFVVKERKNLHVAMKTLSELIRARAPQPKIERAWAWVARLYNGKRYKERGYDELLKAAYKRSPIKGIP